MDGLVYINHGRIIVDCPYGCGSAYVVEPGETVRSCVGNGGCGQAFPVLFPDNLSDLVTELTRRPVPTTRNWYPEGHPIAVKGSLPMGQTVADLSAEFALAIEEGS